MRNLLHSKQQISITYRQHSMKTQGLERRDLGAKWTPKRVFSPLGLRSDSGPECPTKRQQLSGWLLVLSEMVR
jgi:hypothetical protein